MKWKTKLVISPTNIGIFTILMFKLFSSERGIEKLTSNSVRSAYHDRLNLEINLFWRNEGK
jgi:hypothetical protein